MNEPQRTPAYGLRRSLPLSVEEADGRVREELMKEGFGILTEIDVEETLQEKLGADFRPYRILGACNPALAHEALTAETEIGLLLPCNVIVYESEGGEGSEIAVLDPEVQLAVTGREDLLPLARTARAALERALEAV